MDIKTDNLLLRQWRLEDFEFYADFFGDESMAQYYGSTMNRAQA